MIISEFRIRSIIHEALLLEAYKEEQDYLIRTYAPNDPSLAQEIKALKSKQISWLTPRYGEKADRRSQEHPIADSIQILKTFTQKEQAIQKKWKESKEGPPPDIAANPDFLNRWNDNNDHFVRTIRAFYGGEPPWSDPIDISNKSFDELNMLVTASQKPPKIATDSKEPPKEFVAKFGEWNIWLPHSMNDSINIAGYDPEPIKNGINGEHTTWCTNYVINQNLFYSYNGRSQLLMYVIKDNPTPVQRDAKGVAITGSPGQFDYFSFGYKNGQLIPPRDTAETIDRDNRAGSVEKWKKAFGSYYDDIMRTMQDKVNEIGGDSPAVEMPRKAMTDIKVLKQALGSLAKNRVNQEAERIYREAQGVEFSPECVEYIARYLSIQFAITNSTDGKLPNLLLRKSPTVDLPDYGFDKIADFKIDLDNVPKVDAALARKGAKNAELLPQLADLRQKLMTSSIQSEETRQAFRARPSPFADIERIITLTKSNDPQDLREIVDYIIKNKASYICQVLAENTDIPTDIAMQIIDPRTQLGDILEKHRSYGSSKKSPQELRLGQLFNNRNVTPKLSDPAFLDSLDPMLRAKIIDLIIAYRDKYNFKPERRIIPYIIFNTTSAYNLATFLGPPPKGLGIIEDDDVQDFLLRSITENPTFSKLHGLAGIGKTLKLSPDRMKMIPDESDFDMDFDELFKT